MERLRQGYVDRLAHTADELRSVELQHPTDRARVRGIGHRLAGSAAAYGFPALTLLARHTEEAHEDELQRRLDLLLAELDRLRELRHSS